MMSDVTHSTIQTFIEKTKQKEIKWLPIPRYIVKEHDISELNDQIEMMDTEFCKLIPQRSYYFRKNDGIIVLLNADVHNGKGEEDDDNSNKYFLYVQIRKSTPLIQLDGHCYDDQENLQTLGEAIYNYINGDIHLPDDLYIFLYGLFTDQPDNLTSQTPPEV